MLASCRAANPSVCPGRSLGGGKSVSHRESRPQDRTVLLREGQASRGAGATDLLQQLFARDMDHDWIASDAWQWLDLIKVLQLPENRLSPSRIGREPKQARQSCPCEILRARLIVHHEGLACAPIAMKRGRHCDEMAQRLFPVGHLQGSAVAGDIFAQAGHLCFPVGKDQLERVIFMDRGRDSPHLGIVPKQAEEMGLTPIPHVAINVKKDVRIRLLAAAGILQPPQP